MKALKTIWESVSANGRDIISTLFWIVSVLFITQIISSVGTKVGFDIHELRNFIFAIGKFAAAVLLGIGYLTHLTFAQSLGLFDKEEFMNVWTTVLTPKERLDYFFKMSMVGLAAAALVFSLGV